MAICSRCKEFFQPSPDEERLFATGQMEILCLRCAIEKSREKERQLPPAKPLPLRETYGKTDGTKLARVELFSPDGTLKAFLALPPLPTKPVSHTLRKKRKDDFSVMVFASSAGFRTLTEPRITIHTNLKVFREIGQPLKFIKTPSFWCPFTGVPFIEIPREDVVEVEPDSSTVIKLKDGYIQLAYR